MDLRAGMRTGALSTELEVLAGKGLRPGLGLGELLLQLRTDPGFSALFQALMRSFGHESTRYLFKRHGYRLGGCDGELAQLRQLGEDEREGAERGLLVTLQAYVAVQPLSRQTGLPVASDAVESLEWVCALDLPPSSQLESRINQENAFVWLLAGYAAGFLNHGSDRNHHVTCTRQVVANEVSFRFYARASRDAADFDHDLLPDNFKWNLGAAQPTPREASPVRRAVRRVLREESEVGKMLKQVAVTDATVLLLGESGVGKSLLANEVHGMSPRAQQPWVEINCAAIPEQLIESELFGVERGAFSGATLSRKGKFEQAHGGTIFLDEVALLSPGAQSKLLRVLQSGEFERLGSNSTVRCDVRVIAATNEDLERAVKEGKFREDLYYRLNVFPVSIPALRERRNEIPDLAGHCIQRLAAKYRKNIVRCSAQAREVLLSYDWPGNIRELENVLERAIILCPDGTDIQVGHLGSIASKCSLQPELQALPQDARRTDAAGAGRALRTVDDWADQIIESRVANLSTLKDAMLRAALRRSGGNMSLAAASLGVTRAQLNYHLKKMQDPAGGGTP